MRNASCGRSANQHLAKQHSAKQRKANHQITKCRVCCFRGTRWIHMLRVLGCFVLLFLLCVCIWEKSETLTYMCVCVFVSRFLSLLCVLLPSVVACLLNDLCLLYSSCVVFVSSFSFFSTFRSSVLSAVPSTHFAARYAQNGWKRLGAFLGHAFCFQSSPSVFTPFSHN